MVGHPGRVSDENRPACSYFQVQKAAGLLREAKHECTLRCTATAADAVIGWCLTGAFLSTPRDSCQPKSPKSASSPRLRSNNR